MRDKYFGSHELQARTDVTKLSSDRSFGLVFAAVFLVFAIVSFWKGTGRWPWWVAASAGFLLLALLAPKLLAPLNKVWAKLGLLMHAVVSPLMLGLLYYGCIVPIGFLMRLSGKDPLRLAKEPDASSYWIAREPAGPAPESFRNQF